MEKGNKVLLSHREGRVVAGIEAPSADANSWRAPPVTALSSWHASSRCSLPPSRGQAPTPLPQGPWWIASLRPPPS